MKSVADARTELLLGGKMGEAGDTPLTGNDCILLEGKGGRHDLAVDGADRLLVEGPLAFTNQPPHELFGPLRRVDGPAVTLLDLPYLLGKPCPPVEKLQQLGVDGIDPFAELLEILHDSFKKPRRARSPHR